MRRLLVGLVIIASLVTPLASPSPVRAVGQVLEWDDGSSFKVFGANEAIFIAIGTINTDCDELFATADVYVIQGGTSDGAALSDVNGQPNTVVAGGGGFFSETIAFTQPSGSLDEGVYSVVYDECQDGNFDSGTDAVFTDAFEVELPSTLPPIDPSIAALKSRAGQQADRMKTALNLLELYEAYQEIQEAIECITSPGDCIAGMIVDEITGAILDQIRLFLGLGVDPKVAARDAALDTISHYEGIEADPPDPAFEQHTVVPQAAPIDPETGDALVGAEVALGNAHQNEGALAEALLHAIERYQGAEGAEDGDWALVHARQIQSFSTLLAAQLSDSNAAASDLVAALGADPRDIDLVSTTLAPDRQRIVASGFLPEEEQLLLNLGLTTAEIDALQARIAEYTDPISESDLVAALNDLIATNDAAIPTLQTLASDMDAVIAIALVDPDTDDSFPVADAGGPYVAAAGANVTLDGSGSIALAGSLVAHDWDLDGDGQFDDASGATPGVSFATPFAGVIGLRVTDDAGHTGVGHAAITVSAINSPPVITAFSPDAFHPEIIVGTTQEFSVTSSDPDGDPVSVSWLLDGVSAGSGASFSYSPLEADGLGGHWVRAVVSAGGDTRVHDWTPLVLLEDGDADGWRANVDCDDTDATVNRGATEILGNGKDDDCDAATPDAGDAPVALFNPVMSGGGSNAASYEQGARTVAFAGNFFSPQFLVDNMLDDYVGNPDSNQWFAGASSPFAKIDLVGDEPVVIDRVRIQSAPSFGVTQFEIAVSTTTIDDSAFTPVLTASIAASDTIREFVLPTPALAKFVRYRPLSGGPNFTKRLQTWTGQVGTGTMVSFGNLSTDADDDIVSYEWDFGDGSPTSNEESPTHTFPGVGDYTVTLTVTDAIGNTGVFFVLQRILPPPPPPDILLFGPTLAAGATSTEYAEAVKLGLVPRIVTNPEWQALTTADFAGYRAIVFGDSRSSDPFLMNLAAANGSTWGLAITGNIIAFGGDAAVHASRGGADMINRLIQFAIEQPGKTGAVVLLGQYYYNVGANTPVAVLDVMRPGEFRIQGAGCFEPARFTASHPAFVGLTDANLLGWGCVVHEVFNLWPSDFVVITAAAGFGTYVNTDGTVGQPHIVAIGTNITPITRITLAPASATNDPGQSQTLMATVKSGTLPTPNATVAFTVTSGPHTGVSGTGISNASGVATFSYTGSQGGTDEIVATFVDAGVTHTSNVASVTWSEPPLSVDAGDDLAAIEGDEVSLGSATFSDSGPSGTHTATIDWDDGTVENGIVTESPGTVAGSHSYQDDGTFTVEVCVTNAGGTNGCDTLTVTVGNAPPVVSAGAVPALTAGDTVALDLATFTDAGTLDTHTATIDWGDGTVESGTLSQGAGSGSVSGSHAYAAGGDYTVTITVTDDDDDGGSATLDVTVANSNGPPTLTAIGDQTLDEGTTLDVAISALDPDGDALVLSASGLPAFASFSDHGDGSGTLTLTPSFDDAGAYPGITISASDGELSDSETLTITVVDVNRQPTVDAGGPYSVDQGSSITLAASGSDPDGDALAYAWDLDGDGIFETDGESATFSAALLDGPASITVSVQVTDGELAATDTALVDVLNVAPTVQAGNNLVANEGDAVGLDQAVFFDPGTLDVHEVTIDWGDNTTPDSFVLPTGTRDIARSHTYLDDGDYTVVVTVCDDGGGCGFDVAGVEVLNVPPVIDPIADITVNVGQPFSGSATFSDPGVEDGWEISINYDDGTVEQFVITAVEPIPFGHSYSAFGDYTLQLCIYDGGGPQVCVTTTVRVINSPPLVGADQPSVTVDEGQTATQSGTVSDPDGDTVTLSASVGTVADNGDGTWSWTFATADGPSDSQPVTIIADDGNGGSGETGFDLIVLNEDPANNAPDAVDDTLATDEDSPGSVDVLANDTDPDGDPLSVTGSTDGTDGSVSCTPGGSCTYTPDPGFSGSDSFTYTASDGNEGSDTATVSVTVEAPDEPPANNDPDAADDAVTVDEDSGGTSIDVLANDTDPDGDPLTIASNIQPADGSASCTESGCSYTPNPGFSGTDTFTYTVSDGRGGTNTATVTVTVKPVGDDPVVDDPQPSRVVFLLDKSGSMVRRRAEALNAHNSILAELRADQPDATAKLSLFSSCGVQRRFVNKPILAVPALTEARYTPRRGCKSPIYDIVARHIRNQLRAHPDLQLTFVVITDGRDNASIRWSKRRLLELIERKRLAGHRFIFPVRSLTAAAAVAGDQ